ncbi:MAG: hypothetical protein IPK00_27705 [Deltaproteobacteria bacterium]|nr:hypothetical protein [Deltaproteobacteria bacterium]
MPTRPIGLDPSSGFSTVFSSAGLLALTLAAAPSPAQAESCLVEPLPAQCRSYAFTAVVTTVGDPAFLFEPLAVGDTISGTFTLDMDVEDIDPRVDFGFYEDAVKCATVDFPSGRSLEILNDDPAPGQERMILVENDRPQPLGGGFNSFTDNVAGSLGGPSGIVGGFIPPDTRIAGMAVLGFGYGKACIQGFQTPCPPTVISDDAIPGPPGDVTVLDAALLDLNFQELQGPSSAGLFSELQNIDATDPVQCPEPGLGIALAVGGLGLAGFFSARPKAPRSRA